MVWRNVAKIAAAAAEAVGKAFARAVKEELNGKLKMVEISLNLINFIQQVGKRQHGKQQNKRPALHRHAHKRQSDRKRWKQMPGLASHYGFIF
jgi:hypothetical protein